MSRYLLDSDTCVWVLRGREPIRSRVRAASPDELAISTITEAELWFGVHRSSKPQQAIHRIEAFIGPRLQILPFDSKSARQHAELRFALRNQPIGERDLIIASTALAHGLTLVSSNRREFERVPDLELVDWTS